jgi:beta-lactam-binding protein with PASTA domain
MRGMGRAAIEPLILAAALGVLGAMAAVLGLQLNGRDAERSFVDDLVFVPLVLGKDEREATEAVERVGLRPEVTYSRFRAKHPSLGQVVIQSFGSSRIASRGDSVRLVVAVRKRQPRPEYSPFAHWPSYWPS